MAELSTAKKNKLPARDFAFPEQRKEPLTDAKHVRNAIARFDQVQDVCPTPIGRRRGSASRPRRRSSTSTCRRRAGES